MHHKLAVDAVQYGLEVVTLPGILAVKQIQEPEDEPVVHILLRNLGIGIARHDVPQQ